MNLIDLEFLCITQITHGSQSESHIILKKSRQLRINSLLFLWGNYIIYFAKKTHTQRNIILCAERETIFRVNYVHFLVRILSKTTYSRVNGWQTCGDPVVEAAEVSWVAWQHVVPCHLKVVCHCSLMFAGCAILSSMTGAHAEIHRDAVRGIVLRLALHLKLGLRMLNRIPESCFNCVGRCSHYPLVLKYVHTKY